MDLITKYFPKLTEDQLNKFKMMYDVYLDWNSKINVISRKDFEHFYEKHVLHSLAIAKFVSFQPNTTIMDVGTGGGFPGVPLAVMFPECQFLLVDSIAKKIKVVDEVTVALGIKNITTYNARMEELAEDVDFVVSRAVADMKILYDWASKYVIDRHKNSIKNGMIFLKGGDIEKELKPFAKKSMTFELSTYFDEEFFTTKKIVYLSK